MVRSADAFALVYLTPRIAQEALIDFDQGRVNQPFSFNMRRAVQILRAGKGMRVPPKCDQQRESQGCQEKCDTADLYSPDSV